jgi:hypothetical protein
MMTLRWLISASARQHAARPSRSKTWQNVVWHSRPIRPDFYQAIDADAANVEATNNREVIQTYFMTY